MEQSYQQFLLSLKFLVSKSDEYGDGWQKKISARSEVYAMKEIIQNMTVTGSSSRRHDPVLELNDTIDGGLSDDDDEEEDASTLCSASPDLATAVKTVRYIYHVVYSTSYQVPVLYFNAYTLEGKLLSLDEIWAAVPDHFQARLKDERWTFLTQQEHPYLGRPFFQLHPCKTASLMQSLQCEPSSEHYVCSWLSAIGSVVGLSMGSAYFLPSGREAASDAVATQSSDVT
ncbi:ubiquitin-like-conjugating enzyme ATG10 [Sycon ciliatum]|uniref:ubiquitin-like-conjugating enzyme ATG10 n=1 Tax=Sycon ciliatum TaxID=27933 RepID=UPI0031F6D448